MGSPSAGPAFAARTVALAALALLVGCASLQQPPAAGRTRAVELPATWTAAASGATASAGPGITGNTAGTVAASASADATSNPSAATDAPALARWWQRFGDPTLDSLVARSLDAATDVQVAQARLRQARAARELASANLRPTLGANASAQASRSEGAPTTRLYRAGFDAGWEADLWGAGRAAVTAAEADLRASAATLGQTRVSLAAEVAATYIDLRSAQARLATTQASLASQEHTLRLTQWREEAGLVNRLDVEQQRTTVAQTRAQLPALQAGIEQAMNALAVLTGEAPGALHARLANAAPLPAVPGSLALAIPAAVLSQRADVAAAEARVRAALANVEQVDAQRLPSLQLSGSIGLSALAVSALTPGAGVASLLASVDWPLLDGGRLRARVAGQEAALDEARATHRATVLAALQEVEDTLVALRAAREQQTSQQAAVDAARRAAQLAEQRYAGGLVDITSVLLTQRTLLSAEDALATTAASVATQHVRLFKALGGGWSPESLASLTADAADTTGAAPARPTRP